MMVSCVLLLGISACKSSVTAPSSGSGPGPVDTARGLIPLNPSSGDAGVADGGTPARRSLCYQVQPGSTANRLVEATQGNVTPPNAFIEWSCSNGALVMGFAQPDCDLTKYPRFSITLTASGIEQIKDAASRTSTGTFTTSLLVGNQEFLNAYSLVLQYQNRVNDTIKTITVGSCGLSTFGDISFAPPVATGQNPSWRISFSGILADCNIDGQASLSMQGSLDLPLPANFDDACRP